MCCHDRSEAEDPPPAATQDLADRDIWVPARQAAIAVAKPERWLREECQAGHLPYHGEPRTGQVFLVPMTATEDLAEHLNRPGFDGGSGYWIPTPVGSACWAA